jgi:hypothetical protein
MSERLYAMPFNRLYPLYLAKVTKKGRTQAELDAVIGWFTGYAPAQLHDSPLSLRDFFAGAQVPSAATAITGVVCGVRVEAISDPLLQQIRRLDKLVDELARGKALTTIQRVQA